MRLFSAIRAFAPLLVVACSIILGLVTSSDAQLAAYSETRSFRDALDGRSMEEAISGPVDKDTSSYGDRTADSSANNNANGGASAGSSNGGAVAQTMLNIPANGNLNQQQVQEEQQKSAPPASSDGGELEREAGPISPNFPMDTQQKMMEQSSARARARNGNGRQQQQSVRSRNNSGRLMAGSMMRMAQANTRMGRPQKLQQQQQEKTFGSAKDGLTPDSFAAGESFGDETSSDAATKTRMAQNGNKYSASGRSAAAPGSAGQSADYGTESSAAGNGNEIDGGQQRMNGGDDYNQATTPASGDEQQQQQQQLMGMPVQQQREKGFDSGARQQPIMSARQMAPVLANGQATSMDDNKIMNKLRSGAAYSAQTMASQAMGASGRSARQQPSGMAQSMMMSLANKAAYMANQQRQQQQQQQVAQNQLTSPPAMMLPMNGYGAVLPMSGNGMGNGNGAGSYGTNANEQQTQQQQMQAVMPMQAPMGATSNYQMPAAAMLMMNGNAVGSTGNGAPRPMRRANQRQLEKKLSPAMMNAMLNKMLANQQASQDSSNSSMGQYANSNGDYNRAPATRAMMMENLMKTPMGAEMLANMVMMNSNGAASMSANKRDQYKRVLMNAIMQQQQQQQQYQQPQPQPQQMVGGEEEESYGKSAEQQGPVASGNGNKYGERAVTRSPMMPMTGNGNRNGMPSSLSSYQQRPMMGQTMAGSDRPSYGSAVMSSSTAMPPMASAYGQGSSMGDSTDGAYDGQQEQQMENVDSERAGRKTMQKQQMDDGQQQPRDMSMGGDDTKGGSGSSMARGPSMKPMSSTSSYGQQTMRRKGAAQANYGNRDAMPSKPSMQAMQNMMMAMNKMAGSGEQKQQMYGSGMGALQRQQEQQRQEMVDMMSDMNDKATGNGKMGAADAPMNGFRQAYYPEQQQQQQQQMLENDSRRDNGDNYSQTQQQREMGQGTKSAEANKQLTGAPVAARPTTMSYGSGSDDQIEQQQQQQQQQEDGYGAAPMGQAEPFAFNYKTQDNYGNEQYRKEESDRNGVVRGSYGYMDTSGIFRHVEYVADENGFRANVKSNEPGLGNEQAGELGAGKGASASPAGSEQPLDAAGMPEQAAGPAGAPVPPPSSSSSLGGTSGTGDASLRLQQQPEQQQQQQLDIAQVSTAPLMGMNGNANSPMMQAMNGNQQADRELQQQKQSAYGGGMQAAQMNTDSETLAAKSA